MSIKNAVLTFLFGEKKEPPSLWNSPDEYPGIGRKVMLSFIRMGFGGTTAIIIYDGRTWDEILNGDIDRQFRADRPQWRYI